MNADFVTADEFLTIKNLHRVTTGTLLVVRGEERQYNFWRWLDEEGRACPFHEAFDVWLKCPRSRASRRVSILLVEIVGGPLKKSEKGS